MYHIVAKRKVGDAELPPIHFDVDDDSAWEDVIQLIKLETIYNDEPVYVAFGECKGVE